MTSSAPTTTTETKGTTLCNSFDELMDIYNVLNEGKVLSPSPNQISELNHKTSLSPPLKGREVMIPLTSQAFFRGTLQPQMIQNEKKRKRGVGIVEVG